MAENIFTNTHHRDINNFLTQVLLVKTGHAAKHGNDGNNPDNYANGTDLVLSGFTARQKTHRPLGPINIRRFGRRWLGYGLRSTRDVLNNHYQWYIRWLCGQNFQHFGCRKDLIGLRIL